jgi:dihydrofolate synthase/folylpolyglutamate synthase
MTYADAVAYLESLVDYEKLGFRRHFAGGVSLESMRQLLTLLGDPGEGLRYIHIAGTKGKGSVAAMTESILRAAGYTTGLFTSPHLVSFRERIRINGEPVSEAGIASLVDAVRPAVEGIRAAGRLNPATFFEAYTAMAILQFTHLSVDFAVIEVGLGGRLDSTNLIRPIICAITTLGMDHTEILGDTIEAIAAEKAGIMKPWVPCVAAPQVPEAARALAETSARISAPLIPAPASSAQAAPKLPIPDASPQATLPRPMQTVEIDGHGSFSLPLLGAHQATNAAVAVGIIIQLRQQGFDIPDEAVRDGLASVRWPGRFEIAGTRPWLIYDCAHNGQSAQALAATLRASLEYDRLIVVLGVSGDKDVAAIAEQLGPVADHAILTQAANTRALPAKDLAEATGQYWRSHEVVPQVSEALGRAHELADEKDAICITGSFYVVGEAMETAT